jgi:spore coat protein U-like protein
MTGPNGAVLAYGLFTNATMTNYFGDTTGNEDTWTGNQPIYVYGQISAGQYPTPGTYTDTVQSPYPPSGTSHPISVTETILKNCMVTATNLAFGTYLATATSTSTSTISVTCTNTTPYNVGLSGGASGNVAARTMINGTHVLKYSLFQKSTYTTNWGNTVGTDTEAGTGNGLVQPLTVYGQLLSGQFVQAGAYSDTITATVTY